MVAVIGAGCSDAPAENGNPAPPSAGHETYQAVTFAECMRENGVSGFPDPDASGELTIDGVLNGSSLDPDARRGSRPSARVRTCSHRGSRATRRARRSRSARLEFAQCIRDNGVKDFPDPAKASPSSTRIESHPRPPTRRYEHSQRRDGEVRRRLRRATGQSGEASEVDAGRAASWSPWPPAACSRFTVRRSDAGRTRRGRRTP